MSLSLATLLALGGLALVVYFSEQLVKGVVASSMHFHLSAFMISVIFLGFDPENLGVGAAGTYEAVPGIAAGAIIGAAMVAMAFALGVTALFAPMKFKKISWKLLIVPLLAILLFTALAWDQILSRWDGVILIGAYVVSVIYLIYLHKKGIGVRAGGEVAETLEKGSPPTKWKSAALLIFSLLAVIAGSEMLVLGSKELLGEFDITDTVYGMTILAFLVSVEEIARELPAALKGKSDITMGNVIGSVLAFFFFNAGIIALVRPFSIAEITLTFYLPLSVGTVLFIISLLAFTNRISRWAGIVLILIYVVFVAYGY
jgi:cation:H+ antiporter